MRNKRRQPTIGFAWAIAVVVAAGIAFSSPAFGAGSGYTGGTSGGTGNGTGGPSTPQGFTTVLTTQTVQPSGGKVDATSGNTSVSVTVPAGALSAPVQVVITGGSTGALTGLPAGSQPKVAIGIAFEQNGQKVTGTFSSPITVSISDPSIATADQVVVYDPNSGSYVPVSQASNVQNVSVSNGKITFQVLADPYVVVLASSSTTSSSTISSGTSAVTGVPLATEAGVGGLLVIGGLLLAFRLRRRSLRRVA